MCKIKIKSINKSIKNKKIKKGLDKKINEVIKVKSDKGCD